MTRSNLIVGSHDLQNIAKAYVNSVNDIVTFFETNPLKIIITNDNILTQYSIKKVIKVFLKR